jgi:pyridoxal/pyridoxine/pyridoxamine kinase
LLDAASPTQPIQPTPSDYRTSCTVRTTTTTITTTATITTTTTAYFRNNAPSSCAAVSAVMKATHELGSYELQLVAAQDEIANPTKRFVAERIVLRD